MEHTALDILAASSASAFSAEDKEHFSFDNTILKVTHTMHNGTRSDKIEALKRMLGCCLLEIDTLRREA